MQRRGTLDRRTFLRIAGTFSLGLPMVLDACAKPPVAPQNPPATSTSTRLPNYVPAQAVTADLPATGPGLQAGYLSYPKQLAKTVPQPPGVGSTVTAFVQAVAALPPPVDQNPAWQAVNKALNADMRMQLAPSTDYPTRVATLMAGTDIPDLFYILYSLTLGGIPQFLQATATDLTPYVAGSAINDYPNLAALPTSAWKQTVFDGAIYGVPVVRPSFNYTWFVNQNLLDSIGGTQPQNADDFARMLKDLTRPQSNQYGIGMLSPAYGLINSGLGDSPQSALFGTPNNWAVDANGKFTKDIETEEFRAALRFVRDLYAAGVYYPDPTMSLTTQRSGFLAGKFAFTTNAWVAYGPLLWDAAQRLNPPLRVRALRPFSHNGSKPIWHQFQGFNGRTAIKKSSPQRVKELLRILNYLAAPFGSEEYQLLNYGVPGTDFNLDENGNPVLTPKGQADVNVSWQYLVLPMAPLFDPNDSQFVKTAYADQQAMAAVSVPDPTVGLYSETQSSKNGPLTQAFADGLGDIVTGRSPLSALDDLLKNWRIGGGDQMRLEFQQAYARSK